MQAIILILILMAVPSYGANKYTDTRYASCVKRDKHGHIKRNRYLIHKFRERYPCNDAMKKIAPCSKWHVDHIIPLKVGGVDRMDNLQYLPTILKTCKGYCKDRWERKIYGKTPPVPDCK